MDIKTPPKWRKGQTIFNFLWWLKSERGYNSELVDIMTGEQAKTRMADPFHIPDEELDRLFEEYLQTM